MLDVVLAAALALAPAQERRPPEFAADVRMIRLDVSVVDRRGRPVPGLGAGDFAVTEDGRPVELAFFGAVDLVAADEGPSQEGVALEAPPRGPSLRVLLLVDTGGMTHGQLRRASQSAVRYRREAASGEWVRLVNLSTGEAWDGVIPADRARLEAAARALKRRPSPWAQVGRLSDPIEVRTEYSDMPSEAETSGRFLSAFAKGARTDQVGGFEPKRVGPV